MTIVHGYINGGINMAGKADFMKREEELELEMEEQIAERKTPVQYSKMSEKEKIAERKPLQQGFVDNCSKLNVRENPNIDSKVVTILNKGDKVQINSENDGWYGVVYKGISGFCMKEYINKKEV